MTSGRRYTRTAMTLHWLIAVLIAVNVVLALTADSMPDAWVRPFVDTHKSIGITVLGLAILRVLWRASHPPPSLPPSYTKLERAGAHAAHLVLYGLMICLPLSGWIHDSAWKEAATHPMSLFGLVPWPRIGIIEAMEPAAKERFHTITFAIHGWLAYLLYAVFALHVLGALKHQFLDREPELERMLPWGPDPSS